MEQTLNFYKNKRIFLTGHSGFKGSWLNLWLTSLGADVFGYSLEPETQPALYNVLNLKNGIFADILDSEMLERTMKAFKPDIVFHLAAQPLVRKSYREPVLTYQTNVIGTLNVLEAARKCGTVKGFVNITTDKVYENKEEDVKYKETDPLGGYDMYSSSKACSEILSASYRRSFLMPSKYFELTTNSKKFKEETKELIKSLEEQNVVIYGAGQGFFELNKTYNFNKNLHITAIADKKFETQTSNITGLKQITPRQVLNENYEKILITNEQPRGVLKFLTNTLGIPQEKLLTIFNEEIKEEALSLNYLYEHKFDKTLTKLVKKLKNKSVVIYGAGIYFEAILKYFLR